MSHVRYIDKTREYYRAEGYDRAYEWAHFETIPFTSFATLGKPLSRCRVGLVSSGDVVRRDMEPPADDPRALGLLSRYARAVPVISTARDARFPCDRASILARPGVTPRTVPSFRTWAIRVSELPNVILAEGIRLPR